jgi:hypothetical protein
MPLTKFALKRWGIGLQEGLALGVCIAVITLAALYLSRGTPGEVKKVQVLEAQLAESARTIDALRAAQASVPALASPTGDPRVVQAADATPRGNESAEFIQSLQRLESLALRMEARLSQLEAHLKQARLVPLTREENQAEVRRLEKVLHEAQQRLDAANGQVSRFAQTLNVPEPVAKLPPDEAIGDPRYAFYRSYFEARIAAAFAQRIVSAAEDALSGVAVKSY